MKLSPNAALNWFKRSKNKRFLIMSLTSSVRKKVAAKKSKKSKKCKKCKNAGSFFCKPRERERKKRRKQKQKWKKNLRFYRLKLGLAVSALSLTFFSRKPFSVYFYYYERPKNVEKNSRRPLKAWLFNVHGRTCRMGSWFLCDHSTTGVVLISVVVQIKIQIFF